MFKKLLLSLSSAFLAWQSYVLLSKLHMFELNSWLLCFFIAWVINMYITGIFAFLGFAYPTQQLLPRSYYDIHRPQKLKAVYQFLQVDLFRKFLLVTFWKSQKQRKKYFNGKKAGISGLVEQSMKSEFGHLLPFIIINLVSIYLLASISFALGLFTVFFNLLGNMYPIILQRQHRLRIQNIMERQKK